MGEDRDLRGLTTRSLSAPDEAGQRPRRPTVWTSSAITTSQRGRPVMDLRVDILGPTTTLATVQGQVDIAAADHLCNELLGCLDRLPRLLLVELSAVTFLDATAVNALLLVARSGAHRGVSLVLIGAPSHVQRVLETLNLRDVLRQATSVEEALARADELTSDRGCAIDYARPE
jgi:anti-sigma B factor antagonist